MSSPRTQFMEAFPNAVERNNGLELFVQLEGFSVKFWPTTQKWVILDKGETRSYGGFEVGISRLLKAVPLKQGRDKKAAHAYKVRMDALSVDQRRSEDYWFNHQYRERIARWHVADMRKRQANMLRKIEELFPAEDGGIHMTHEQVEEMVKNLEKGWESYVKWKFNIQL